MARIFISYRRDDSEVEAGRIYDRLEAHFRRGSVFMDVDDIPLGIDFREHLDRQIRTCDALLAVIGKRWLTIRDRSKRRRLDAPQDYVRTEIELALERGIPVIPVLLRGVAMPRESDLPPSIAAFAYRNAARVDPGAGFRIHMDRLIRGLEKLLPIGGTRVDPPPEEDAPAGGGLPTPADATTLSEPPSRALFVKQLELRQRKLLEKQAKRRPKTEHASPQKAPQALLTETDQLLAELQDAETQPPRRLEIGDRLAELGEHGPAWA